MKFILGNYVDDIIYYNAKKFRSNIVYRSHILRKLHSCGFDEVIQAGISRKQGDADVMAWSCKSKNTLGFYPRYWNTCEIIISNKWFTKLIDGKFGSNHELDRMDFISNEIKSKIGDYRSDKKVLKKDIFSVCVNASTPVREWGISKFINVARKLKEETNLTPVFIGDNHNIKDRLLEIDYNSINLIGKTSFAEMCAIISESKFIITNDSAPMHLGVYFETPTIAIVSGGEFNSYCKYPEPYDKYILAISMMENSCFNCGWNCIYKKYDGKPFPCLSETTAEYVIERALEWQPIKNMIKPTSYP